MKRKNRLRKMGSAKMGSKHSLKHGGQGQHYGKGDTWRKTWGMGGVVLCISEKSIWGQENMQLYLACSLSMNSKKPSETEAKWASKGAGGENRGRGASEKNLAFIVNETELPEFSIREMTELNSVFKGHCSCCEKGTVGRVRGGIKDTSSAAPVEIQGLLSQHCETEYETKYKTVNVLRENGKN